jgi:uncharacterized protein YerC
MVRLNRYELDETQRKKLLDELSKAISLVQPGQTDQFLSELLGFEERVMIAKRLAIIVLLLEEYSLYEIGKLLKVSPTTAHSLKLKLDSGELDCIVKEISKNKNVYIDLFEALDSILHLGGILPRYKAYRRKRT